MRGLKSIDWAGFGSCGSSSSAKGAHGYAGACRSWCVFCMSVAAFAPPDMPTGKIDIRTCRISPPWVGIVETAIIEPERRILTLPAFMTVITARLDTISGRPLSRRFCSSISSKEMAVVSKQRQGKSGAADATMPPEKHLFNFAHVAVAACHREPHSAMNCGLSNGRYSQ
jgi:hypothetical protein